MSYYHKYNFTSPEPIYAIVKEELKSYFDTGAVDDLLFPTYVNKCLEKLGKSSYAIVPVLLFIDNFTSRLPDNFYAVREAWACVQGDGLVYQNPSAFYSQANALTSIQLSPLTINGTSTCNSPICNNSDCTGDCLPTVIQAVYKTNESVCRTAFQRHFLLQPGNITMSSDCQFSYNNDENLYGNYSPLEKPYNAESPHSASYDSFDIRDNKFITTFRKGIVELIMYANDYDCDGNQMIPDNFRIREYIEAFIKFKVFENLYHQTTDESFNQIQQKMTAYKQVADEAYIMAQMEIQKQTVHEKLRAIKRVKNRFNMYELPNYNRGYRRRRNH